MRIGYQTNIIIFRNILKSRSLQTGYQMSDYHGKNVNLYV